MTTPEAIDLAALRAVCVAATPGPWRTAGKYVRAGERTVTDCRYRNGESDAYFIAAANPRTVLALLDRIAAAEACIAGVREVFGLVNHYDHVKRYLSAYDRAIAGQQQRQEGTT
jgi:hypothetical protein